MSVTELRTAKATARDDTVTYLRELLARAEGGEIIAFAGAFELADGWEYVCTITGRAEAIGALHLAALSRASTP